MLVLTEPTATLVGGAGLVLLMMLIYRFFKMKFVHLGEKSRGFNAGMIKAAHQALGGIRETKILQREAYFTQVFEQQARSMMRANALNQVLQQLPRLIIETIVVIIICGAIALTITTNLGNQQMIPIIALFGVAVIRLMPSASRILTALQQLNYSSASLLAINRDLHKKRDVQIDLRDKLTDQEFIFTENIEFRNVSFNYENTSQQVIKNISFTIPKNSSVGIVGPSGSGKSTLMDLTMGLLTPTNGEILIDGISLSGKERLWQSKLGYVPQEIYLLDDSIRANILYGIDEANVDATRLDKAVADAQLDKMVQSLPDGLNTIIGERGSRLSGGQRQRIGIARALYNTAEVLFFDEATSALDAETEKEITQAIKGMKKTKTIVIIAHNPNTVSECDIIVEISEGTIVRSHSDFNSTDHPIITQSAQ
jgi:ABC-type multidrug transport system fused ATPase/permease subunit